MKSTNWRNCWFLGLHNNFFKHDEVIMNNSNSVITFRHSVSPEKQLRKCDALNGWEFHWNFPLVTEISGRSDRPYIVLANICCETEMRYTPFFIQTASFLSITLIISYVLSFFAYGIDRDNLIWRWSKWAKGSIQPYLLEGCKKFQRLARA